MVGVLCLTASPLWLYLLLFPEGYDYLAGIFVLFAAVVANIGLVIHVSRDDAELRHIMLVGFFVKLMGAAAYLTVMLHYYHGGDLFGYFHWGSEIARNIREYGEIGGLRGEFSFNSNSAWNGSIVLIVITGGLFSIIGPSLAGAIVIFSSFAYWGSYLFWKGFTRAFPESDRYLAATLMFFMPSLVFWSATLGKDALMYFFIGLVTYGLCQALYGARSRAVLLIAVGLLGVAVIRAHIASILALTLCAVFLITKNRSGIGGVLSRIALIPLLVVGSVYTTNSAREKLGITETQSAQQVATNWSGLTQYGGSSFESGSFTSRIVMSPFLPFRPFPWEVNSAQTMLASAEGTFLLLMLWVNRRGLKLSLRHWRSDPFVTFILLFSLETSAALSSAFSNFGLLARERIMFTPLLILLIPAYRHTKAAGTPSVAQPAFKQKVLIRSAAQAAMSDR
jgi:hypothetical protein